MQIATTGVDDRGAADDRAAIAALVYGYARAIDTGDLDAFGDAFADGTLRIAGSPVAAAGADAVRAMVRKGLQWYDDGTPKTKHVTTNLVVTVDPSGREATAHSYVTVFQALPDFPYQPILGAHYDDRFVRGPDGWRFAERALTYDLLGDLSRHFTKPVPGAGARGAGARGAGGGERG